MLKKLIILFLIAVPMGMYAQEKLAFINTQEVFTQMPELKDVETKLNAKREEIKKVMTDIETEFNNKVKEFSESKDEPTETLVMERDKTLQDIRKRYETYAETSDKEYGELQQQLLSPLQQKLQKAIKDVGDEQGYTYIFEIGAIPYMSSKAVDAGRLVKTKLGIN